MAWPSGFPADPSRMATAYPTRQPEWDVGFCLPVRKYETGAAMRAAGAVEETDDVLLSCAARGDGAAFARLVERHRGRLMALSTRILGNRAIAEEIVQETFTRAWVNAPHWKPQSREGGTVVSWLSRVAVNLSIDQARKAQSMPLGGGGRTRRSGARGRCAADRRREEGEVDDRVEKIYRHGSAPRWR